MSEFVYLARAKREPLLKIGFSRDPAKRMATLRRPATLLWALETKHARDIERRAHKLLEDSCEEGEWFKATEQTARWAILMAQREMLRWHRTHRRKLPAAPIIAFINTREVTIWRGDRIWWRGPEVRREWRYCPRMLNPRH